MNRDSNNLLSFIDDRIKKILKGQPTVRKYVGTVVTVIDSSWANIKISGFDTVFRVSNHSGEALEEGDSIYIEVINESMSTAMIVQRLDTLTNAERSNGFSTHSHTLLCYPVGSVYLNVNSGMQSKLRTMFGGEWESLGSDGGVYRYKRIR